MVQDFVRSPDLILRTTTEQDSKQSEEEHNNK